jgi:transposase-like protein
MLGGRMRRTTLNEKQRALALLVALGQFTYQEIARQIGIHHNSVTNWLKDERIQALVNEIQHDIQDKMEGMALESVQRKNTFLLSKAIETLERMLTSKSQKKQLAVIRLLLEYGVLDEVIHKKQDEPQGEQISPLRLDPELRSRLRVTQS